MPPRKTQAGPEESGIKTLRPLLTALQCGEPPGLWSGSLKLRSVGSGLHPSRLHSTQITIYYPPICTPAPAIGERSRRGEGTGKRGKKIKWRQHLIWLSSRQRKSPWAAGIKCFSVPAVQALAQRQTEPQQLRMQPPLFSFSAWSGFLRLREDEGEHSKMTSTNLPL